MKRTLHLLLVLGALIGLFGQGIAFAMGPSFPDRADTGVTMSQDMECPEMAKMQQEESKPCKGLTLACIAQMGCALPMTFKESFAPKAGESVVALAAIWPQLATLSGRSLAPEPEPPTNLS